jgi:hypothetical protein
MTTIRRTRVPEHPAVDTDSTTPRTAGTPHGRAGDADPVRLALIDSPGQRTTLDGAWWPRTRSLSDELPGLVQELHRRGIRVTRAAYHPDTWETAPRRMAADGRTIRLGWFRSIDPQLLELTGDTTRGRLDLLVVPPDTAAAAARQAFIAASDRANRVAVGEAPPAGIEATAAWDSEMAVWDSEGATHSAESDSVTEHRCGADHVPSPSRHQPHPGPQPRRGARRRGAGSLR